MTPEIEDLLRAEAPQVLGALVRRFGRFDIAEDAVQEALLAAARSWPAEGVPEGPRSWLIRVAYRRMVDLLRSDQARKRRELEAGAAELAMADPARAAQAGGTDDSLTLLLLCCHPALGHTSQVALTLRAVGGLTTAEIAHAYGASEATMGTRISRAKQQLAKAGARFSLPTGDDRDSRMAAVLQVLYLIFNEGYTATAGADLTRVDLTAEAIRLTRMLHATLPGDAEVTGLLALMLLTESRRAARTEAGELVPLDQQDPAQWNRDMIAEGTALIDSVWNRAPAGPYQIQAAIAAVHAAAEPGHTDWAQIAMLYLWLERLTPTPPVQLARVVAVAHAHGPERGLALLDDLNQRYHLDSNPLTRQREHAVRAHLLQQVGDSTTAAELFRRAAELTGNQVEQRYLRDKADGIA
ncbi:sigma-70 family RNA polymerase sigma factor [Nocardia cyriacigeorgica]|uniref:RNA polymerase sigma factor n=1 Tax=Nocardia cyriacigeorgica TaxID=135487 RepID=UPI001895F1F3|nr:sigma-70 family RNA polymerase sigma factor [Nocardia cyriacigeorgica]MBF6161393.1 sigma-70 family RNA polymerase sigma factor [Nocardia cyriacigeorgica]MBF6200182.1 sigma-70 family RNA polymerase sigma factor [Nocardia cyriacigeorgica]MBF6318528.1 sigma-70 family RNA polymerase sigma factor [Nocardia cyriacigeorgica]MBF6341925.1 sigma-70 family RNA polymerase sigma factor [Nocardia cyriacigeorgica]MBF6513116.1 sigma-70 family RNA polymerase sigma factor [Nocardia cyriacigeorgica]